MDPGVKCHVMNFKAKPTGFLWSKFESFLISGYKDKEQIIHFGDILDFGL